MLVVLIMTGTALICIFLTRPVTVLLHELGHAVPAILLTRKSVTIYAGSYGDPTRSRKIKLGKLTIWFTYNPFLWNSGLCIYSMDNTSLWKQIICTISGPLISLILGTATCLLMFAVPQHPALMLLMIAFTGSFAYDFYVNIKPSGQPVKLYNGQSVYNDGMSLLQMIQTRKYPSQYHLGILLYSERKYELAGKEFELLIQQKNTKPVFYRMLIACYLNLKENEKVIQVFDDFRFAHKMNANDYMIAGTTLLELERFEEGLDLLNESLRLNPSDAQVLNNKGYALNVLERYAEALTFFNQAIIFDPQFAFAYNNRGLAKMMLGALEEGYDDVLESLKMRGKNAYALRNLGIYHFEKKQYDEALEWFSKSSLLDSNTHQLDEWMRKTKHAINLREASR